MRNYCFFLLLFSVVVFTACDEDKENDVIEIVAAPEIVSPRDSSEIIITANNLDSTIDFKWSAAKYTTLNLVPLYYLQLDSTDNNFENPYLFYTLSDTTIKISCDSLNKVVIKLGAVDSVAFFVKLRVQSFIDNDLIQNSESIVYSITPFFEPDPKVDLQRNDNQFIISDEIDTRRKPKLYRN